MANQQLLDYVTGQKNAGATAEALTKRLVEAGWPQTEIDAVYSVIGWQTPGSNLPPLPPVSTPPTTPGPEKMPEPKSGTVYGDGSLVNVFDLGLPDKNPTFDLSSHPSGTPTESNQSPTTPPEKPKDGLKDVTAPFTPLVVSPVPPKEEVSAKHEEPGGEKGGLIKKLLLVAAILVTLGILGGVVWWVIKQNQIPPVTNETVSSIPQPVSGSPESGDTTAADTISASGSGILDDKPYVSSKGFRIIPPKGWVADESASFGTLVTFSNPNIDDENGNKFAANINVVTEDVKGATLDDYLKTSKEMLKKTFTSYTEISEKKITVGNKPGVLLEATYEMGVYSLHNQQLMLVDKGGVFVITGTTLASNWATYKSVIEASLLTFSN